MGTSDFSEILKEIKKVQKLVTTFPAQDQIAKPWPTEKDEAPTSNKSQSIGERQSNGQLLSELCLLSNQDPIPLGMRISGVAGTLPQSKRRD